MARFSPRDVRETTYASTIKKEADEGDHESDRPTDILHGETSQCDRDGYEQKLPDPHCTEAIFWHPYALALFLCTFYNPVGETPSNRRRDYTSM